MRITFTTITGVGSSWTVTAVVSTPTATLFLLAYILMLLLAFISPLGSHGYPDLILNWHACLKQDMYSTLKPHTEEVMPYLANLEVCWNMQAQLGL